jgi:hypothetical protein
MSNITTHTTELVDGHLSRRHSSHGDPAIISDESTTSYHETSVAPGGRQLLEVSNSNTLAHTEAGTHLDGDDLTTELQPVQWRIFPYTPVAMVLLFLFGVLVAVGHHLFYLQFTPRYRSNDLRRDSGYLSQIWIIRYGTAFAFLAKTLLAGSVVIAYKQYMWINLRHKDNTLYTIDAIFAATYDPLALLSPSMFLKAKIPSLMALLAWYDYS